MPGWKKNILVACFVLHFALILLISIRQGTSDLARGDTIFRHSFKPAIYRMDVIASTMLGERLSIGNGWRQTVSAYIHLAGIDTGYGFFAPSVSASHKLVFEIRYPDGRVEYELPRIRDAATGVRMPLLLDNIARTRYEFLRKTMLKIMAFSVWQEHPDADVIRAVFGFVRLPSVSEFQNGQGESYETLYAYDFRFGHGLKTAPSVP